MDLCSNVWFKLWIYIFKDATNKISVSLYWWQMLFELGGNQHHRVFNMKRQKNKEKKKKKILVNLKLARYSSRSCGGWLSLTTEYLRALDNISCHAVIVYSCTVQPLCTVVQCSCCVFYKSSLYSLLKGTMPCIIHKTGNIITSYHALLSAVTSCHNMQSCLSLRAGRIDYIHIHCSWYVLIYNRLFAAIVYSFTVQLLCTVVWCSCCVQ